MSSPPTNGAGPAVVQPDRLDPHACLEGARLLMYGGTGFVGKVWLSLVLHHFPDIGHIYLVVRSRKRADGSIRQSSEQRFWAEVATSQVFDPLRKRYPGAAYESWIKTKITPIDGDVTGRYGGISDEFRDQLRGTLTALVNSAGVVDFNPPLDYSLNVNAFGMQNLVSLCKDLGGPEGGLKFMHTSTCYVAGGRTGEVHEVHPLSFPFPRAEELDRSHWDPEREIAECVDTVEGARHRSNDAFRQSHFLDQAKRKLQAKNEPARGSALEDELVKVKRAFVEGQLRDWGTERAQYWGWPNIYTYTKSLGEQILCTSGLVFTIVRPAVVESALSFPEVGWCEGINTSAPLIYMAMKGPVSYAAGDDSVLDVVPVDQVAIGMTLSLCELIEGSHRAVYQYGTSDTNPLEMLRLIELVAMYKRRFYKDKARGNPVVNWFQAHIEPQGLNIEDYRAKGPSVRAKQVKGLGSFVRKLGQGPLAGLAGQAAKQLEGLSKQLEVQASIADQFVPFTAIHNYRFDCSNTRAAYDRLSQADQALLPWVPDSFDWREYLHDVHCPGLARHVDPLIDERIQRAKKPFRSFDHLVQLLDEAAERHDLAPALCRTEDDGISRLSYRDFRGRAQAVAVRLANAGVQPGDRVLLSAANHPVWPISWFGIQLAGAVSVPIDPALGEDAVRNICESAGVTFALVDGVAESSFGNALPQARMNPHAAAELGAVGSLPALDIQGDTLASILYTSGTTGVPKGVMLTHGNFCGLLASLARVFPLEASDRVLSVLPLHHAFEFTCGLLLPMSQGARIVYLDRVDADRLAYGLNEGQITCMVGVPALWQLLERRIRAQVKDKGQLFELAFDAGLDLNRSFGKATGFDLGTLMFGSVHNRFGGRIRMLISGGAALPPDTHKLFVGLGLPLAEGYGLTEAAPVLTAQIPKPGAKAGHVGKALPGVEIRIEAPDEAGVGEVQARGPNVMVGYYGNEEATAAAVDSDGWLRTGDLGRLDHRGRLVIMGRAKDVVVTAAGENIYLDDVEHRLGAVTWVKELALVGLPAPRGGERLGLLAVPDKGAHPELSRAEVFRRADEALRKAIAKLSQVERPAVVHLVEADLPRTATRKVKRADVQRTLTKLVRASERPADGGLADPVARAIAAVAGIDPSRISTETSMADTLAFDSLMWVELAAALDGLGMARPDPDELAACTTVGDVVAKVGATPLLAAPEEDGRPDVVELPEILQQPLKDAMAKVQERFNGPGLRTRVLGRAHIPAHRQVIVVTNHTSHLDMGLVKYALGDYGAKMVALAAQDYFFEGNPWKVAYFKNLTNVQPIDRKRGFRASLRQAVEVVDQGNVVLIFPEGTRSPDGTLQEFKPLVGVLALETGVDILPMHISGAHKAMPKGALLPRKRGITIRVGPPLEISELRRITDGLKSSDAARQVARLSRDAVEKLGEGSVLNLSDVGAPVTTKVVTVDQLMAEVFSELPARLDPEAVEGPICWYFSLGGKEGPRWTVQVTDDGCKVLPGRPPGGAADCVVKCSPDFFRRLVREAYVPTPEEFMSGTIKTNDIPGLIQFSRVFKLSDVDSVGA